MPANRTHHPVCLGGRISPRLLAVLAVLLACAVVGAVRAVPAHAASVYYVATTGSDSASGASSAPWRTVAKSLPRLRAGDTLEVRGGTYAERVQLSVGAGTSAARITVRNYPGERPVISGLLWLKGASYWTIDGINVTWSTADSASEHMVKMTGGTGWRITNSEFWGARSYAALLISGSPSQWTVDHNYIHNTYKSNSTNQDHLIYVNAGMGAGVIERNVLAHSPNGRGVKIGPPSATTTPQGNVVIRYNTFYDNLGPSNVQLSYSASSVAIYRNIFSLAGSGQTNVTAYHLNGTGNMAHDNIGYYSSGVIAKASGLTNGGGNLLVNPGFTAGTTNFATVPASITTYGRYAP